MTRGIDERFAEALRRLSDSAAGLDPNDVQAVVAIGSAIEMLCAEASPEIRDLTDVLALTLESLQAIYEKSMSDVDRVAAGVAEALAAAESHVSSPGEDADTRLRTAARDLWICLGKDPEECPEWWRKEPIPLDESASLDDAAALLVQAEPSDTEDLEKVRGILGLVVSDASFPDDVRQLAAQAEQKVCQAVSGSVPSPEDCLAEAGQLIEAAMNDMEDQGLVVSPQAVPELDPLPIPTPIPADIAPDTFVLIPSDADSSLMSEFITECREYIEASEAALLAMESDPEDAESVNTVFRAFHTIKGTSAFLGLTGLSELAHKAENLLSRVRDHEIRCTGGYADLALRSTDMLRELIQGVQDALGGSAPEKPESYDVLMAILADPEAAGVSGDTVDRVEPSAEKGGQPSGETALQPDESKALRTPKRASGDQTAESSMRVRTDRLDRLVDMVGELVIAQSMVSQDQSIILCEDHELSKKVVHLGKIVRELQYLGMSMRMVPLKPTFQKMARLVRDLAHKSGKAVEFVTEGDDTEIDRNMVDAINDPLVHMVRNAADHGIEPPDVRVQAGKPRTGTVRLAAYHSGSNVIVEMRDDGKGLDRNRIVEKAISKGLIESDKGMSDHEVFNLIFAPGFSTAEKITDVSGRGVGLDVVRKNVEALRGKVEISSEFGKGCTFMLRLPLTMAVTDGMLVKVGGERFIVPTISIRLSLRPEPRALSTVVGRGEMLMLRGELMPIFRLHRLFGITGAVERPIDGLLVVVDDGDRRCALLVDEILGQQHVVAKSLGEGIGKVQGVSGGAILGDGCVGLIIDPSEVAVLARQQAGAGREVVSGLAA